MTGVLLLSRNPGCGHIQRPSRRGRARPQSPEPSRRRHCLCCAYESGTASRMFHRWESWRDPPGCLSRCLHVSGRHAWNGRREWTGQILTFVRDADDGVQAVQPGRHPVRRPSSSSSRAWRASSGPSLRGSRLREQVPRGASTRSPGDLSPFEPAWGGRTRSVSVHHHPDGGEAC